MTEYVEGDWIDCADELPRTTGQWYETQLPNGKQPQLCYSPDGDTSDWKDRAGLLRGPVRWFRPAKQVPPPPALEPEIEVDDLMITWQISDIAGLVYERANMEHKHIMRAQIKAHQAQMLELHRAYLQLIKSVKFGFPSLMRTGRDNYQREQNEQQAHIHNLLQKAGVTVQEPKP